MKINYLYSKSKGIYVMKNLIKYVFMFILALVLNACTTSGAREKVKGGDLETLVQAVQYGIDKASTSKTWLDFSGSAEGWIGECKKHTEDLQLSKASLLENAGLLCSSVCKGGNCNLPQSKYCELLAEGKDVNKNVGCVSTDPKDPYKKWCDSAKKFNNSLELQKVACSMAESLSPPELKNATLEVVVSSKDAAGGKIQLLVFSAGASIEKTTANTMTIQLAPVAASARDAYCATHTLSTEECLKVTIPKNMQLLTYKPNDKAIELGEKIYTLIIEHAKAIGFKKSLSDQEKIIPRVMRRIAKDDKPIAPTDTTPKEINMMPSSFKIALQVGVSKTGEFQVGANLLENTGPSLGASKTKSITNSIVIEYER